jgi:predicted component of type VI protein secretion system
MDVAALSMNMNQASLAQAVSLNVMSLAKEQAVQQGADLVQMLQSVQPNLGRNLDIKA